MGNKNLKQQRSQAIIQKCKSDAIKQVISEDVLLRSAPMEKLLTIFEWKLNEAGYSIQKKATRKEFNLEVNADSEIDFTKLKRVRTEPYKGYMITVGCPHSYGYVGMAQNGDKIIKSDSLAPMYYRKIEEMKDLIDREVFSYES